MKRFLKALTILWYLIAIAGISAAVGAGIAAVFGHWKVLAAVVLVLLFCALSAFTRDVE